MRIAGLIIGFVVLLPVLIATATLGPTLFRFIQTKQVLANGVVAKAVILALNDTGSRINFSPVVEISLRVSPVDGQPYETTIKQTISVLNEQSFRPGQTLRVKYDPKNHARVAIIFGQI